jgi:hypothetical protein
MDDWPAGSHLVLETIVENVPLLAVGYKYNGRKVQCFVATKGAGHTENGVSYVAKWKNKHRNTLTRNIPRPEIISKYYTSSNVIDKGNQSRQSHLRLEKHWVTEDGFFRLITTLFGICITDCWLGYKHHLHPNHHHKKTEIEIVSFASILAKDCLYNSYSSDYCEDQDLVLMDHTPAQPSTITGLLSTVALPLTVPNDTFPSPCTLPLTIPPVHCLVENKGSMKHTKSTVSVSGVKCKKEGNRIVRGTCLICPRKTKYYCKVCPGGQKNRTRPWLCSQQCFTQYHPAN